MKRRPPQKLVSAIDPLVDPMIAYLVLAGLIKPLAYSIVDITQPDALVRPIVGEIWRGLDATVLSVSLAYLISAGFLLLVRSKNRGSHISIVFSKRTANLLSVGISALAIVAIAEGYVLGSKYFSAIILPIYFGWISISADKMRLSTLMLISGLIYIATLSKWVIIASVLALSLSVSAISAVALIFFYPLLNQLRFFLVGLSLGFSISESIQFLTIRSNELAFSTVSLLYRLQSFEGVYLSSSVMTGSSLYKGVSALNLSRIISFDVHQLDYGLAVSLFSQLHFSLGNPILAAFILIMLVVLYFFLARAIVRRDPSLNLILGLYPPLILADGFIPIRSIYFVVGVAVFLILISILKSHIALTNRNEAIKN